MSGTVLILGAKSGIARAVAHEFAKAGYNLVLAGRNAQDLAADASDYAIRHGVKTWPVAFDAVNYESHPAFYAQLPARPDVVICMVGYLPDQKEAEKDSALAIRAMETNYVGCAHILNIAANEMEERKSGSIIGVSSVAGDRGRAKNYFYGSAKAGFTAFLSGLRNRLTVSGSGVHVLTVLPGFVYTAMTEGMDLPPKLTATPEQVARDIFRAWKKKKNILYTKGIWRWVMLIIRNIPEGMFKKKEI
jgi:hypothetical protein